MNAGMTSTLSLAAVLFLTGCATGGGSSSERASSGSDRITREEILLVGNVGADQVVQSLRPRWLRPRRGGGFSGPSLPEVFVDGRHFGPLTSLYQVSSANIQSMELLGAADATTLYGTGYPGGIISITTIR